MHDLPHAPRHIVRDPVSTATRGGTTRPTATACTRRSRSSANAGGRAAIAAAQSRGGGAARQLGATRIPRNVTDLNAATQAHAVRRLPRPRLDLPRRLQARPQGQLLDARTRKSWPSTIPNKFEKAVHLKDIHLERACSASTATSRRTTTATASSTAKPRAAVEIDCVDCHGTIARAADADDHRTGRAARRDRPARCARPSARGASSGTRAALVQRSMVDRTWSGRSRRCSTRSRRARPNYNAKARCAKTMQTDGTTWGAPARRANWRTPTSKMSCYTCHTSWTTSCFGCHLPMKANAKRTSAAQRGRRRTQQLHDLQLPGPARRRLHARHGRHGEEATGSRRCARRAPWWSARRTPTASGSTTSSRRSRPRASAGRRSTRTSRTPCARRRPRPAPTATSRATNDNNADGAAAAAGHELRQLRRPLRLGRRGQHGFEAVAVTECDEPQAVIGSYLHKLAYPDELRARIRSDGSELTEAYAARRRRVLEPAAARRIPVRRRRARAASRSTTSPTSTTRASASASSPRRSRRSASDSTSRRSTRRCDRLADHAGGRSGRAGAIPRTRSSRSIRSTRYLYVTDREEGLILIRRGARCSTATRATTS